MKIYVQSQWRVVLLWYCIFWQSSIQRGRHTQLCIITSLKWIIQICSNFYCWVCKIAFYSPNHIVVWGNFPFKARIVISVTWTFQICSDFHGCVFAIVVHLQNEHMMSGFHYKAYISPSPLFLRSCPTWRQERGYAWVRSNHSSAPCRDSAPRVPLGQQRACQSEKRSTGCATSWMTSWLGSASTAGKSWSGKNADLFFMPLWPKWLRFRVRVKGPLTCKCLMTSVDVYESLHHKIITC